MLPKVLLGYSGGRPSGTNVKEKGREEGEAGEGSRQEIAQEVVAGIKEKASAQDDTKATAQRTSGQRVKQSWDCSQIDNEEEEEEDDWQKEDQMGRQWDEDEKLEEFLERRRMEGSSLQVEVMKNVPELVVHERMSWVEKTKCPKEKKKVKGWSTEEVKNKANSQSYGRHRRNEQMERDESGRGGSMLEEFG